MYVFLFNRTLSSTEEQKKFQALFDQSYSFVTLLDSVGRVMEVNQAALFYIDKKPQELHGQYFADTPWWVHSPQSHNLIQSALKASLSGDFKRFEVTHRSLDGKINFFDYTLKPIFDENDRVKLVFAEGRDITKMKRVEQALVESEERLLAFSESTYEGLIIVEGNNIIDLNESALMMFGYEKPSDVIGARLIDQLFKEDERKKLHESLTNGFQHPCEITGILNDGTTLPVEVLGRSIVYKGETHTVLAIRDLTERKRAQRALVDSEEKYRLIAENITDIIFKIDLDFNFTYISSSIFTTLGYTVEEAMNMSVREFFPRNDLGRLTRIIALQKKLFFESDFRVLEPVSFDARLIKKDGDRVWMHASAKIVPSTAGKPVEILGICRNIDELKKAQIELRENEKRLIEQNIEYERLNDELIDLNMKLIAAKEKAEESDKLKSSFLANMSHEIRTPMNSIIGFSKLCLRDQLEEDKRKLYAGYVIENGEQLLSIVNDILDLSKIEAGQIKIKPVVFCLNGLIDNLFLNCQQHNTKGLLLLHKKGLPDSLCQVWGDKVRINQVLSNLLNNAMKFTAKGHIRMGYSLTDRYIQFSVEDTGIGIKPEHQTAIFERFRQADPETTRIYGGTGLGLAICKKLVEMMDGRIWLESEPGKGSVFSFTIPYVPAEKDFATTDNGAASDSQENRSSRPSVLIAEDEESNFIFLNEILKENKYNVLWARTGKDAVDIALSNMEIKLVLMDVKMPGMDGFTATRLIKEKRPRLPVVAQTAFAMISDRETALANGCDDYIAKPIDQELLLKILSRFIP